MTDFQMPDPRPYNAKFWDAAADGRLVIQECVSCGTSPYPPRSACPECLGDLVWHERDGTASLYSYTHLHHPDPPDAIPEEETPVVGCIAELDGDVRMASRLVGGDPDALAIGMDLAVTFGETPDGRAIPLFEPA
jgi:hypothetical protein